jgi:hypothetical protein
LPLVVIPSEARNRTIEVAITVSIGNALI